MMAFWAFPPSLLWIIVTVAALCLLGALAEKLHLMGPIALKHMGLVPGGLFLVFLGCLVRGVGKYLWAFAVLALLTSLLLAPWDTLRASLTIERSSGRVCVLLLSLMEMAVILAFTVQWWLFRSGLLITDNASMAFLISLKNLVLSGLLLVAFGTAFFQLRKRFPSSNPPPSSPR